MNSKKADVLKHLDEAAKVHDRSLREGLSVAAHPERFGWRKSLLTAAVVVPLTGVSAVLNDISRVLLTHSDDEAWDKDQSPPGPPKGPSAIE